MPGRDANATRNSSTPELSGPLEGQGSHVRGALNPRAPGTARREAKYPVPALHVQTGVALAYLAAAVLSWALALVAGVLAVLHVFPGR